MSSFLLHLIVAILIATCTAQNQPNGTNFTIITTLPQTTSTSEYFTTEPGCSSNYAFVYIESTSQTLSETVLSERTNFPPYGYGTTILNTKVVLYAEGNPINDTSNNPCDISTFNTPKSYYDNTIVLLTYDQYYDTLCTPQQWTLNLQNYANVKAVLIANTVEIPSVYSLPGNTALTDPTIPTRMISKNAYDKIINSTQEIFGSIACFNDTTHPPAICVIDDNPEIDTSNMILDGVYQEQLIMVNDHAIWMKPAHYGYFVHPAFYIWLTVNHSATDDQNPWRWVLGTDYTEDSTIEVECILNVTDYIDDPTECDDNWYREGVLEPLTSHGGICHVEEKFLCVDEGSITDAAAIAGRYRAYHKKFAYWINEESGAYLFPYEDFPIDGYYNFIFATGSGSQLNIVAICAFLPSDQELTSEVLMAPQDCGPPWFVFALNPHLGINTGSPFYGWELDVDECFHPNATNVSSIAYPETLCLTDTGSDITFYETYHGIWTLDTTREFDGRYVYKNQRLNGSWFFLHVDEFDSWAINNGVPGPNTAIPNRLEGICNEDVDTPDRCEQCWWFYTAFVNENRCNASLVPINSTVESDCMQTINYTELISHEPREEIVACFDDDSGAHLYNISGVWKLQNGTVIDDRYVWTLNDEWYIYYSKRWKYWVIDQQIRTAVIPEWHLICLLWQEYEPWNCTQWYSKVTVNNNFNDIPPQRVDMIIDCYQYLCFNNNGEYSHYQGLFGVYELGNATVYTQQSGEDWYILWNNERKAWIINDEMTIFHYESICNQNVAIPYMCSQYWEFYGGYQDIIGNESNAVLDLQYSNNESECITPIMDATVEYTQNIVLCFDDGMNAFYENNLTGEYLLGDTLYNDRHFWYKNDTFGRYYLFYNTHQRVWAISETFDTPFNVYCLLWDEFEPFNCQMWYDKSYTQTMSYTNCVLPTQSPTMMQSTLMTDSMSSRDDLNAESEAMSQSLMTWLIIGGVILCCCIVIILRFFCKNGQSKKNNIAQSWQSKGSEDAIVQMHETVKYNRNEEIFDEGMEKVNTTAEPAVQTPKEPTEDSELIDKKWEKFETNDDPFDVKAVDVNPFDDGDTPNIKKARLSTAGTDGDNPFMKSYVDSEDGALPTSAQKRDNWTAFDEFEM